MSDKAQIEPFNYQASTNIDEHRQIVDKTNEIIGVINDVDLDEINTKLADLTGKVDTNTSDISANTTSITNLDAKLTTDESQITTNKENIESLRDANLIITKEISDIKEVDKDQNTQITALGNADIATATSAFDNTARKLTIELNPKSGDPITTDVVIPASGETGDEYTATAPIGISNKNIALAIDTDTMEITDDGKLKSKVEGTSYTAGTGITIDDSNAINVDETVIATKATVDNLDTQVKDCASGVANAITQAQTANTNALDAYNAVSLSDTHLVLTKGNGDSDEIVISTSVGNIKAIRITLSNVMNARYKPIIYLRKSRYGMSSGYKGMDEICTGEIGFNDYGSSVKTFNLIFGYLFIDNGTPNFISAYYTSSDEGKTFTFSNGSRRAIYVEGSSVSGLKTTLTENSTSDSIGAIYLDENLPTTDSAKYALPYYLDIDEINPDSNN